MRFLGLLAALIIVCVVGFSNIPVGASDEPIRYETYTVELGDTLWEIAATKYKGKHTGAIVCEIQRINAVGDKPLDPIIYPGQEIKLPVE